MSPWVVTATGCGVVFAVLACIALFMQAFQWFDRRAQADRGSQALPNPQPAQALPSEDLPIDPLTLVLISAAVAAVVKKPARIYRVRPIQKRAWAAMEEGEAAFGPTDVWGSR